MSESSACNGRTRTRITTTHERTGSWRLFACGQVVGRYQCACRWVGWVGIVAMRGSKQLSKLTHWTRPPFFFLLSVWRGAIARSCHRFVFGFFLFRSDFRSVGCCCSSVPSCQSGYSPCVFEATKPKLRAARGSPRSEASTSINASQVGAQPCREDQRTGWTCKVVLCRKPYGASATTA